MEVELCSMIFLQDQYFIYFIDTDECASQQCGQATCLNTYGSYSCSCDPGIILFKPSPSDIQSGLNTWTLIWPLKGLFLLDRYMNEPDV